MAKKILSVGSPAGFEAIVRSSDQCAAITSLKYLTALHSSKRIEGSFIDIDTFRTGLLQIKPDISYFKAIAYWTGEIHPGEYDLVTHIDNAGLSEHLGENLREKSINYASPLRT